MVRPPSGLPEWRKRIKMGNKRGKTRKVNKKAIPKENQILQGLLFAVEKGFNKMGKILINHSSKVLFLAVHEGHDKVIAMLLKNINLEKKDGATPLYMAAKRGNLKVLEILLKKKGIKVNMANENGRTALFIASENGHEKVVELLLKKKGIAINKAQSMVSLHCS